MPITALPTPPTRSDPTNFSARADAFFVALPLFVTQANALEVAVDLSETNAAISEVNAAASEAAAAASSGATIWVSGTTYAIGNVRFSPITYLSYRRKTAGAGTTDPSADGTNWQLLNSLGNVDLVSTQTLTNKTFSTGSVWNGTAVPIANGGTGSTTAANAFAAIKQAASETATGVVELATTAEAATGTDTTRAITAAGVASAIVALAPATVVNTIASKVVNDIGTYAWAWNISGSDVAPSAGIAGSSLRAWSTGSAPPPTTSISTVAPNGAYFSGTWRNMGTYARAVYNDGVDNFYSPSLWLRIA